MPRYPNKKRSPRWVGVSLKGNSKGTSTNNCNKKKRWKIVKKVVSQKAWREPENEKGHI